jgi:hypothetical protein
MLAGQISAILSAKLSFLILYVVCLNMLPVAKTIKLQAIGSLVYNELERFLREESYHILGHHY